MHSACWGAARRQRTWFRRVFIKVWNGREQLGEIQNLEAWCMRITKNLSLDRLRQQKQETDGFPGECAPRSE
ncbi:MAG: sigma factor [Bacteroidota bacterium]